MISIGILPLEKTQKARLFEPTATNETQAQISPDGKWIAYSASPSGQYDVYVQSFPIPGKKYRVSREGAIQSRWRGDGKELFYYASDGQLMSVPVTGNLALPFGAPAPLFRPRLLNGPVPTVYFQPQYDVTADGQRFLLNVPAGQDDNRSPITDNPPPITIVLNWDAILKK